MASSSAAAVSLTPIAAGDLSAKQAREVVQQYLAANARAGEALYRAFRAWTWRSLTERRYDSDLRSWWELMRTTGAHLQQSRQTAYAERLQALCDLLYESIQFGEDEPVEQILKRVHVQRALHLVSAGWVDRPSLKTSLGLKEANLSRLLSLLQSRGLIERRQQSRIASFRLTRAGLEALRSLPAPAVLASAHSVRDASLAAQNLARFMADTRMRESLSRVAVAALQKRHVRNRVVHAGGGDPVSSGGIMVVASRFYGGGRPTAVAKDEAALNNAEAPLRVYFRDPDVVEIKRASVASILGHSEGDKMGGVRGVYTVGDVERAERFNTVLEYSVAKARPELGTCYVRGLKMPLPTEPVRKLTNG